MNSILDPIISVFHFNLLPTNCSLFLPHTEKSIPAILKYKSFFLSDVSDVTSIVYLDKLLQLSDTANLIYL